MVVVSNPYRYGRNAEEALPAATPGLFMFQTLIGTVGTPVVSYLRQELEGWVSNPYRYGRNQSPHLGKFIRLLPRFQTLIGTVGTLLAMVRDLEFKFVSNPYRYGRNLTIRLNWIWERGLFQTLIGTVGTRWEDLDAPEPRLFQTLIGTVGTSPLMSSRLVDTWRFKPL